MDIVTIPADVLRTKAEPVADINDEIQALAEQMIATLHTASGIGLAAPQVDRLLRMFVVQVKDDKPRVFINPQIIGTSMETVRMEEGCLSIPGLYADVVRAESVQIQAWNERGRPFSISADGLLARVILHEYDHLDGVLFLDHLSERRREKLLKKYDTALKTV